MISVTCLVCKKKIDSRLVGEKATQEVISTLTTHVKISHPEENKNFLEVLNEVQLAVKVIPSYLILSSFVDLESDETSEEVKEMMVGKDVLKDGSLEHTDGIEDMLEPLFDLFGDSDDEETDGEESYEETESLIKTE